MAGFAPYPVTLTRKYRVAAYAAAVLVVAASAAIRWLLNPALGDNGPYLLFMPGVMLAALLGGLGPGLLASVLASLVAAYFWVEPHFTLVFATNDEIAHAVTSIMVGASASSLVHLLQKARQAERQASAAKDRFLATLSHELRQPLAPMMAAVDTLDRQPDSSPELHDAVQVIRRSLALHARIIDDLLDVNRIVAGKLPLRPEICDLHRVLRLAIEACLPEIEAKGVRLHTRFDAVGCSINGDPMRLQQVFWNLLRNATKFTPGGGTITVCSACEDQRIRIDVQDTGVGIKPEKLSSLFRAFEQAHGDLSTRLGGLGLGLAICKGLIELHGGEIRASSGGPGRGATFTVLLPVSEAVAPRRPAAHASGSRRILLVDDQPETLRLLERLLRQAGYDVVTANDMKSALATAHSQFDLLLSDQQLPDGTGTELLQSLRARVAVRAICLSGESSEAEISRSLQAGFHRHLVKPVPFAQLQQAIAETLDT